MSLAWAASPLALIIQVLAAYRLTRLWTRDTLPPLPRLRDTVTARWGDRAWSELFTCPWCAGFWISVAVVALASSPLAPAWNWLALALAISAVVGKLAAHDSDEE